MKRAAICLVLLLAFIAPAEAGCFFFWCWHGHHRHHHRLHRRTHVVRIIHETVHERVIVKKAAPVPLPDLGPIR